MKLKAFDLFDIMDLAEQVIIKEKLAPYVKYFVPVDSIVICLQENVKTIKNIIKENGYDTDDLEIINLDKFYKTAEGWDYIYLGDLEIDGDEAWKEFGKIIKEKEEEFLNTNNFEEVWFMYQRLALKNILDKTINKEIKAFDERIKEAKTDFKNHMGIFKIK